MAITIAVNKKLDSIFNIISSPLTDNSDINTRLDGVRAELEALTSTQTSEQEQIKKLLEESLNTEVLRHLTKEIEAEIEICIEKNIVGLVEGELNKFIPKEIRQKVDEQELEVQQFYVKLQNSEARRSNSFIETPRQFRENLQHLVNESGDKSDLFPKTVKDLLELEAEKVIALVGFYGMEAPDQKSKVPNLNWFLREIGVTYQYVYRRPFRPFPS